MSLPPVKTLIPNGTVLDQIVKIYKNEDNKVIGIHTVSIVIDKVEIQDLPPEQKVLKKKFPRKAKINTDFARFNLDLGGSRIIDTVQLIGKYDDFEYNNTETDIVSVEYQGDSETNTFVIPLDMLPTIGDSL